LRNSFNAPEEKHGLSKLSNSNVTSIRPVFEKQLNLDSKWFDSKCRHSYKKEKEKISSKSESRVRDKMAPWGTWEDYCEKKIYNHQSLLE
jgi:hypothetical protein